MTDRGKVRAITTWGISRFSSWSSRQFRIFSANTLLNSSLFEAFYCRKLQYISKNYSCNSRKSVAICCLFYQNSPFLPIIFWWIFCLFLFRLTTFDFYHTTILGYSWFSFPHFDKSRSFMGRFYSKIYNLLCDFLIQFVIFFLNQYMNWSMHKIWPIEQFHSSEMI